MTVACQTLPAAGDRVVNQAELLSSWSLCSFLGEGNNNCMHKYKILCETVIMPWLKYKAGSRVMAVLP